MSKPVDISVRYDMIALDLRTLLIIHIRGTLFEDNIWTQEARHIQNGLERFTHKVSHH